MKVGTWTRKTWKGEHLGPSHWRLDQVSSQPRLAYITADGVRVEPRHRLETDLGSIPRPLWSLFPPDEFSGPYICHDEVYLRPQGRPRSWCDAMLRESIEAWDPGHWCKLRLIWLGVRLGGWLPWARYRIRDSVRDLPEAHRLRRVVMWACARRKGGNT